MPQLRILDDMEHTIVKIKRFSNFETAKDRIPEKGEPVYSIKTNELFIGNGENKVSELRPVAILNNVVKGIDGRMYKVDIKDEYDIEAVPISFTIENNDFYHKLMGCNKQTYDLYAVDN